MTTATVQSMSVAEQIEDCWTQFMEGRRRDSQLAEQEGIAAAYAHAGATGYTSDSVLIEQSPVSKPRRSRSIFGFLNKKTHPRVLLTRSQSRQLRNRRVPEDVNWAQVRLSRRQRHWLNEAREMQLRRRND